VCWCTQARHEGLVGFVEAFAQIVDDMAALLSASALQLLGGCHGAAMAWETLQASRGCAVHCFMQLMFRAQKHSRPKCRQTARCQYCTTRP
jgi:surfactin synthase thioesterase subunit